jgi:hypothetical protein
MPNASFARDRTERQQKDGIEREKESIAEYFLEAVPSTVVIQDHATNQS